MLQKFMKTLVTGANGFVGYWVARKLCEAGFSVRAMIRGKPTHHLQSLSGIEIVLGDLLDRDSMQKALVSCDYLFHVAAHYSLWEKNPQIFYDINVSGSRTLFTLAKEVGVKKIVYTSSVATLKLSFDGTPVDETSVAEIGDIVSDYKRSKYLAEEVALELAGEGLPIIIVNPSAPIGGYDVKPTPTGKIITDFLNGKMPAYLDTGLNLVSVEDVAIGHLLALEKGEFGQRYILGNENLRLIEIFQLLEKISGVKAPTIRLPYSLAYLAGVVSESIARMTNRPPSVPLDGVRMAKKKMFFSAEKAKQKLGFSPTSIELALGQAVEWFRQNHYCK